LRSTEVDSGWMSSRSSSVSLVHLDADPEILVVTSGWPHDAAPMYGIFLQRQVESLRGLGYRFDVLFIRGFESTAAYAVAAARLMRTTTRYRLLHAHGGEAAVPSIVFRRAPMLVSYCGDDLLGTPRADGTIPPQARLRRALIRQTARFARQTITKSAELEAHLPRALRARNTILPNGVDISVFAPSSRDEARAELGWPVDEPVVLFAGDPGVPRKGYPLAEAACAAARSQVPNLRLHIGNDVPPGDMPRLMNAADCLLLTSSLEGSPNVVKEALMCNLPVVATPVGDVRELLRDVRPSAVCRPEPHELARALIGILTTRERSNGRERSADALSSETVAKRLATIYDSLMR
jgi:teichuronic acid biosynthesis glycosyltransferase TuaC